MKVLLIQPPHYYNGLSREPENFPLGLGYIAKVLLNMKQKVEVLDIWAHQYTNEEVVERIRKLDYHIVGISALSTQYSYVKWLSKRLKEKNDAEIILGGALATHSPETVLKNTAVDVCVIGEGEVTIGEVVEDYDALDKVKGIYFKDGNDLVRNEARDYIKSLDDIDFPAWDLFPMSIYLKTRRFYGHPPMKPLNVITSRGCPWNCRFCSKTFKKVRFRSIGNVMEEIELLKEKYSINCVVFNDELLMTNRKRVHELCDRIEPLNIKFICQGRANLVDPDSLKRMKKAGAIAIGYGIESGSQRILENMNKGVTVKQAERALNDTIGAGIHPIIYMMYGYPGETRETLKETVDFFKRIPYVENVYLAITTALPGSELYEDCLKKGLVEDEEKYLESVSAGYRIGSARLLLNFTEFNEQEFHEIRREVERKIFLEQVKKYPYAFIKFLIRQRLIRLRARIRKLLKMDEYEAD